MPHDLPSGLTDRPTRENDDSEALQGRVVISDPSLVSDDGHNLDYAGVFVRDAISCGQTPILLANNAFKGEVRGCEVRPVFEYSIYQHADIVAHRGLPRWVRFARLPTSLRNRFESRFQGKAQQLRDEGRGVEADWIMVGWSLLRFFLTLAGGPLALLIRLANPTPRPFNRDDFATALARELDRLNLTADDTVIVHTASFGLMESLSEARLLMKGGHATPSALHLIFHMSPTASDARTYLDRYFQFSAIETSTLRLTVGSPCQRTYLWATSTSLKEELEALTGSSFAIWEHITDVSPDQAQAVSAAQAGRRARPGVIRIGVRAVDLRSSLLNPIVEVLGELANKSKVELKILARQSVATGDAANLAAQVVQSEVIDVSTDAAYLDTIASCDLFLIPYKSDQFARRISALLGDCAMLGVPIVAMEGTTLASSSTYTDIFTFKTDADVAHAITAAADNVLERKARTAPAEIKAGVSVYFRNTARALQARTLSPPSLQTEPELKVAVVLTPFWGKCGSTREFEAQFRILNQLGYLTIQIFLKRERLGDWRETPYNYKVLGENSITGRANVQRLGVRTLFNQWGVILDPRYRRASALGQLALLHAQARLYEPHLESLLKSAKICMINHCFHVEFAHRRVGGVKVLDTHDVQSIHLERAGVRNALTRAPESMQRLFDDEKRLVASVDAIVNVSEHDDRIFRQINPASRAIFPWVPPRRLESQFPTVEAWAKRYRPDHDWYWGIEDFALLLSGDAHNANLESARWFIDQVYLPHLHQYEYRLALTGRLSDAMYAAYGAIPHVFYMSFVDDIDEIRALSRVAILPDRVGAGISNKTIETLSRGLAFTSTSFSMRGINDLLETPTPTFDTPKAFADDVRQLLRFKKHHAARSALAEKIYREHFGFEHIFNDWKQILAASGIKDPKIQE